MGFLQLIPADKLAAAYDTVKKELYLYAQGKAVKFTSGINFTRNTWFGGYKFSLMGWVGPLASPPATTPYKYSQTFHIDLQGHEGYPKNVIIATANNPEGVPVEIRYLGVGESENFMTATDVVRGAPASGAVNGSSRNLTVLFKEPFNITQAANVPPGGAIDIKFDSEFLTMQTASIEHPATGQGSRGEDIVWTFNSLQTGNTQIVVTIYGGMATFVMQIVYNVRIIVL